MLLISANVYNGCKKKISINSLNFWEFMKTFLNLRPRMPTDTSYHSSARNIDLPLCVQVTCYNLNDCMDCSHWSYLIHVWILFGGDVDNHDSHQIITYNTNSTFYKIFFTNLHCM
jgi:hypothetical protein